MHVITHSQQFLVWAPPLLTARLSPGDPSFSTRGGEALLLLHSPHLQFRRRTLAFPPLASRYSKSLWLPYPTSSPSQAPRPPPPHKCVADPAPLRIPPPPHYSRLSINLPRPSPNNDATTGGTPPDPAWELCPVHHRVAAPPLGAARPRPTAELPLKLRATYH
jgi:hypothetical protein